MRRITPDALFDMKKNGEKIAAITAYDYSMAKLIDQAGADIILVGDSLGMVLYGLRDTLGVTMEMMLMHTAAVVRGVDRAMVVADMPFMSYQLSEDDAVKNAGDLMRLTGCAAVKLEGHYTSLIRRLTDIGIPVIAHLGYTPQSARKYGYHIIRGRSDKEHDAILEAARDLDNAGACALVAESVPESLGKELSQVVAMPVIGIGAGRFCDGEIQVCYDVLGIYPDFLPKHASIFKHAGRAIKNGAKAYVQAVKNHRFPTEENCTKK